MVGDGRRVGFKLNPSSVFDKAAHSSKPAKTFFLKIKDAAAELASVVKDRVQATGTEKTQIGSASPDHTGHLSDVEALKHSEVLNQHRNKYIEVFNRNARQGLEKSRSKLDFLIKHFDPTKEVTENGGRWKTRATLDLAAKRDLYLTFQYAKAILLANEIPLDAIADIKLEPAEDDNTQPAIEITFKNNGGSLAVKFSTDSQSGVGVTKDFSLKRGGETTVFNFRNTGTFSIKSDHDSNLSTYKVWKELETYKEGETYKTREIINTRETYGDTAAVYELLPLLIDQAAEIDLYTHVFSASNLKQTEKAIDKDARKQTRRFRQKFSIENFASHLSDGASELAKRVKLQASELHLGEDKAYQKWKASHASVIKKIKYINDESKPAEKRAEQSAALLKELASRYKKAAKALDAENAVKEKIKGELEQINAFLGNKDITPETTRSLEYQKSRLLGKFEASSKRYFDAIEIIRDVDLFTFHGITDGVTSEKYARELTASEYASGKVGDKLRAEIFITELTYLEHDAKDLRFGDLVFKQNQELTVPISQLTQKELDETFSALTDNEIDEAFSALTGRLNKLDRKESASQVKDGVKHFARLCQYCTTSESLYEPALKLEKKLAAFKGIDDPSRYDINDFLEEVKAFFKKNSPAIKDTGVQALVSNKLSTEDSYLGSDLPVSFRASTKRTSAFKDLSESFRGSSYDGDSCPGLVSADSSLSSSSEEGSVDSS